MGQTGRLAWRSDRNIRGPPYDFPEHWNRPHPVAGDDVEPQLAYSQFTALAVHHGVVEGTWAGVADPENVTDFAGLIREAVEKTNYHGSTVSLLLANSRLTQQLIEVPPVKGANLKKSSQREAEQQKLFSGEAAWTFQNSLAVKGVQRVILHLMPSTGLERLIQACQQNGLHLNSVMPVSAVLQQQLSRFR